jgi:hypothetical protein
LLVLISYLTAQCTIIDYLKLGVSPLRATVSGTEIAVSDDDDDEDGDDY